MLLILGGMRVGDTFHLIPFFDKHKEYNITWYSGSYEQEAVKYLQQLFPNIIETVILNDGFPGNLKDRDDFKAKAFNQVDITKYDKVISDICVSFDAGPLTYQLKDRYFDLKYDIGNYIVYHLDTVSDWKRHLQVRDFKPTLPGFTLGKKGDFIVPDTYDFTNHNLDLTSNLIAGCKLFVGIHSAMTCLTFYINKPMIVIHPMDGLMKFGDFRKNITDLIKPTTQQLEEAIQKKLEGLK